MLAPAPTRPRVLVDNVVAAACRHFRIGRESLFTKSRSEQAVHRRFATIFVVRELTTASLHAVGGRFDLDHSTVLYAAQKAAERIASNGKFASDVSAIRELVLRPKPQQPQVCPHCHQEMPSAAPEPSGDPYLDKLKMVARA